MLYLVSAIDITSIGHIEVAFVANYLYNILISGISNSNKKIQLSLTLFFLNNRDKKELFGILKRFVYFGIIISIFFIVYNPLINNMLYQLLNDYIPSPHNIIIYNMLPKKGTRYRMLAMIFCWFFNQ